MFPTRTSVGSCMTTSCTRIISSTNCYSAILLNVWLLHVDIYRCTQRIAVSQPPCSSPMRRPSRESECTTRITPMFCRRRNPIQQEPVQLGDGFSVNVWAGIVRDHFARPYIWPQLLRRGNYLNLLQHVLQHLLNHAHVSAAMRSSICFQHEGALDNYSTDVRLHLNATYGQ